MVDVSDLTDGGYTFLPNPTYLCRGEPQGDEITLLGNQLDPSPGRAGHLPTLARLHFHIVDHRTQGNLLHWETVSDLDVRLGSGFDGIADLKSARVEDVTLFSVLVENEGDVGGPVGIVFDLSHAPGDSHFVPLEIDQAVPAFVATPTASGCDPAVMVSSPGT
jgi:hypothetical protein